MPQIFLPPFVNKRKKILALGGESEGVFGFFEKGKIFISENFGDLILEENFFNFKKEVEKIFKKLKPDLILTDLHPLYRTTLLGENLAKKFKIKNLKIQHHISHIFSVFGQELIEKKKLNSQEFLGIACDGTGYGIDGKIWGGEIFKIQNAKCKNQNENPKYKNNKKLKITRVGHLENQKMIGGDLAVKEPARMLIAILAKIRNSNIEIRNKFKIQNSKFKTNEKIKDFVYQFVKKFYTKNQFEILYNQLQQNFNCQETSSTGRILDAVSLLLGFAKNERKLKHQASILLEKNSSLPYFIKPKIKEIFPFEVSTTYLFEYLVKNFKKDKKRLAATAQIYLAKGFFEICQRVGKNLPVYFGGGLAKNKIFSQYLKKRGVKLVEILPPGDQSLSFGQIIYSLLADF